MADFIAELLQKPSHPMDSSKEGWWVLQVDGASRVFDYKVGLILQSPIGKLLEQAIRLGFLASNNEVEYEAILVELDLALILAVAKLKICSDSQLVIGQIQIEYEAKDKCMAHYLTLVQAGLAKLSECVVERVPQLENLKTDALERIATTLPINEAVLLPIYLQTTSSIATATICSTSETDTN